MRTSHLWLGFAPSDFALGNLGDTFGIMLNERYLVQSSYQLNQRVHCVCRCSGMKIYLAVNFIKALGYSKWETGALD
jgi:hypothetical protein